MTATFETGDYARIRAGAIASAEIIVPLLVARYRPEDVVDVGCGEGWFASRFAADGIEVDGIDLERPATLAPGVPFVPRDLARPGSLNDLLVRDMAVCLEVAEHLPPGRGPGLVDELCALAGTVAFSAAVPGQTGHGHVNCRWQSYWAALFAGHGYLPDVAIRDAIWHDDGVEAWYRQNLLVYSREHPPSAGRGPLDVVHPVMFSWFAPPTPLG